MGTTEIIIVFSALMALIALVTIGIDWIGKPLKHRRFIPRLYRFDDEKLPLDKYGNPVLEPAPLPEHGLPPFQAPAAFAAPPTQTPPPAPRPGPASNPVPYSQPAPIVVARVDPSPASDRTASNTAKATTESGKPVSGSAFSTSVAGAASSNEATSELTGDWLSGSPGFGEEAPPAADWTPGMALDATTVKGAKPNLATKAARFWQTTAAELTDSHFDEVNLKRMADGKAPRRNNPRTGRTEAMQLTGLRQASRRDEVLMSWPGSSVDPWNAT